MSIELKKALLVAASSLLAHATHAIDIERPKIQIVDALGVNVTTGQVTHSLTPVSIGGAMGLSYTLSIYANELRWGAEGFHSSYAGEAKAVQLSREIGYSPRYSMRVSDNAGSADFKVLVNGVVQDDIHNTQPPYTYEPIGDQRHTLVVNGAFLEWTKPDGTLVRYGKAQNTPAGLGGGIHEIVYPNGFTINIGSNGISNNAGFQLKPIMVPDNRPMDKPDNPNLVGVPPATSSAGSGWSSTNPKYIKALNNAVEYCAPAPATCAPTQNWPTATFDWPAGMPRTMFIGDSVVKVTNANGATTEFRYRAYDLAYNQYGQVVQGYTAGTEFTPRLVGIKPGASTQETFSYDYNNLFVIQTFSEFGWGMWSARAPTAGLVKNATHIDKHGYYAMFQSTQGGQDYRNNASGDGGVTAVHIHPKLIMGNPDLVGYTDTKEGRVTFETNNARNFPSLFDKVSGPDERYTYDARGNLRKVEYLIGAAYVTHMEAQYPASCTPSTRKTCNQAEWIADAKGNTTYYTYHSESGQVASVTSPPDKNGKRAQTRYEYTQKSARYFNGGSTKINGSPIWMKTAEKYCINSNYSGTCEGGDEVVTRFEYNHDNLLMTGTTVTDPATSKTLRTCFQYDIYGNQIGKTEPKAGLSSCN